MRLAVELRDSVLGHSYFSVREIRVKGGEKIGGSEIVGLAGLSHGMNIWKIDSRMIERKIGEHPWVRRVLVRREFPRRVVIEVEERSARAIVMLGKPYYVDTEGFVFKEVGGGETVDFPLITGLSREELASESHLTRQKIQEVLKLSELMTGTGLSLSEIHFRPQGGVVLYPMGYQVPLRMGWGEWQGKLERLERVVPEWKGKEGRLEALDASFRDQVVARLRKG